jgi:osmotically-inducible protein OsmY/transcriptional regulator with XRE-family HTH domain
MTARRGRQGSKQPEPTFADEVQAARRNRELITELARRRSEDGTSQAEVAKRMHTSQPAVTRLESHQHDVQLSTLARYVTALGLSLHFVLTDSDTGERTWTSMSMPELEGPSAVERSKQQQTVNVSEREFPGLIVIDGNWAKLSGPDLEHQPSVLAAAADPSWTLVYANVHGKSVTVEEVTPEAGRTESAEDPGVLGIFGPVDLDPVAIAYTIESAHRKHRQVLTLVAKIRNPAMADVGAQPDTPDESARVDIASTPNVQARFIEVLIEFLGRATKDSGRVVMWQSPERERMVEVLASRGQAGGRMSGTPPHRRPKGVGAMRGREDLREAIKEELLFDPLVEPTNVTVNETNGEVTLDGTVQSYPQYLEAAAAAQRVAGVKKVQNHLEVVLPRGDVRDDATLTTAANNALALDITVPDGVEATAREGNLRLSGTVSFGRQRTAAAEAVAGLIGVHSIENEIRIIGGADPAEVTVTVQNAVDRYSLDVEVDNDGGTVTLSGQVRNWAERDAVISAAWMAGGVAHVRDELNITGQQPSD